MSIQHRLATPVIQPRMRFFDKEGKPLIGGKVYAFKVGTEEFKPTYRNSEFTALNQNPIVLDNAGSALIYLRGSNQLRIYDKDGNHIENRIEYQQLERAQFYDDYGKPLKNGFVYTYDYQSTIKKTSYSIDDVTNPNPIVLDENGTALVNIVGAYRLRQYNSKNVFVGDQDFKRPPIKVLTSVVYPLYFKEGLKVSFGLLGCEQRVIMTETNLDENIESLHSIYSATIRNPMNQLITNPESVFSNFSMTGATVEEIRSKYQTTSMPSENVSSAFAIKSAQITKQIGFINNTMQPECVLSNFAISGAKITN